MPQPDCTKFSRLRLDFLATWVVVRKTGGAIRLPRRALRFRCMRFGRFSPNFRQTSSPFSQICLYPNSGNQRDNGALMTQISAIELENFQSIEQRTRIELKPITLLFGPNSAGKSAVFDALELLRTLLDPTMFNLKQATDMVDRWARRKGNEPVRETFIAVEFPFKFEDLYEIWSDDANWNEGLNRSENPGFWLDYGDDVQQHGLQGAIVRIELQLKVINLNYSTACRLSEFRCFLKGRPIVTISKAHATQQDDEELAYRSGENDNWHRWLNIYNDFGFINSSLSLDINQMAAGKDRDSFLVWNESEERVQVGIISMSLSPLKITPYSLLYGGGIKDSPNRICRNASDVLFYFGTLLYKNLRGQPGIVMSDRRAPKPSEALTVVDLGLSGWWSRQTFSPASPASLLMTVSANLDEHFQGLAEIAHAELLLRTATADDWGDPHAAKHIEPVSIRARALERVNHHLEKSLFTEKLYKLSCSATLMVPIDLTEDNPWSYYALAQPAAVRLFLQDGDGQKVDFQDVGSGIPFVLPILYVVACQGFVKVQQPELHLHPALQASLADVFVEELNRSGAGQFLIETHSEHILLRLLRRIRDTENGKSLADDMKIINKDVAIYYFDPKVTGGTIVTQQLVTPLGDFYTDWPRGFFMERNRDLFDE